MYLVIALLVDLFHLCVRTFLSIIVLLCWSIRHMLS
jgi:hypothetical protein